MAFVDTRSEEAKQLDTLSTQQIHWSGKLQIPPLGSGGERGASVSIGRWFRKPQIPPLRSG
jgi:hypothetical protein